MPVYDYHCVVCGKTFSQLRPLAEYASDSDCPDCGCPAPRSISAPQLNLMKAQVRFAHQTNERSRHEPRLSKHVCGAHCSHGKEKPALASGRANQRPWMLGH